MDYQAAVISLNKRLADAMRSGQKPSQIKGWFQPEMHSLLMHAGAAGNWEEASKVFAWFLYAGAVQDFIVQMQAAKHAETVGFANKVIAFANSAAEVARKSADAASKAAKSANVAAKAALKENALRQSENAEHLLQLAKAAKDARSKGAQKAAKGRLVNDRDGKQAAKQFVKECWRDWQMKRSRYKGKAAFARDMLTKGLTLESGKKIEDWCRKWEREQSA